MAKPILKKVNVSAKAVKISPETKKSVDLNQKAAYHFEMAGKLHSEAARFHETGDHTKALHSALLASGHAHQAIDSQKADAKHQAKVGE